MEALLKLQARTPSGSVPLSLRISAPDGFTLRASSWGHTISQGHTLPGTHLSPSLWCHGQLAMYTYVHSESA
jgi:hypothetical protein